MYIQCKSCYLLGSLLVDSGGRRDTAGAQRFSAAAIFGDSEALFAPLKCIIRYEARGPRGKAHSDPRRSGGKIPKHDNTTRMSFKVPPPPRCNKAGGGVGRKAPEQLRAASDGPRPFEFCVHLIDAFCLAELKQTKWPRSRRQGVMARLCKQAEYKGLTTNARKSTSL